ncbi:hypothetical protein [Circovirus-like genome RW-A]|uniref:hypothetical protein n=1 Tax=Circovirus-like genome RW-A TaxID=642251 RepID=UPI0001AE5DB3|nr:hypothetical protein [Circovirus-like genome RW-A]ACQ78157.1 hypothetical protein [Circovirus-like genome RW-A]
MEWESTQSEDLTDVSLDSSEEGLSNSDAYEGSSDEAESTQSEQDFPQRIPSETRLMSSSGSIELATSQEMERPLKRQRLTEPSTTSLTHGYPLSQSQKDFSPILSSSEGIKSTESWSNSQSTNSRTPPEAGSFQALHGSCHIRRSTEHLPSSRKTLSRLSLNAIRRGLMSQIGGMGGGQRQ